MSQWGEGVPNPGSKEAGKQGCTCAVIDNNHGRGTRWGEDFPAFWVSGGCPLHDLSGKEDPCPSSVKSPE